MQANAERSNNYPYFGKAIRRAFSLEHDFAHLNNGSYGATPVAVMASQHVWQDRMEREPSRFMRHEMPPAIRNAAAALAGHIGAEPDAIALVENATGAVNAVLRNLELSAEDEILVTDQTYPAVRNTVDYVAGRSGAKVTELALPFPAKSSDEIISLYTGALATSPSLVILDHVTSPTALALPVTELARMSKQAGALVLIDGAHAPGMLDLDLSAIDCDWYTGNCHKWMFAPKGCAFLWTSAPRRHETHPLVISHGYRTGYVEEFGWVGTRDMSAQLALPAALDFMAFHGPGNIRNHNHALVQDAADMLAAAWGTERGTGAELTGSMATIRMPGIPGYTAEEAEALRWHIADRYRVQVPVRAARDAFWCRISAQIYNDEADYIRLEKAVRELAGL